MKHSHRKAFTLVEVTLVLGIIALVAAGVIGGMIMIRNARIHKMIVEITDVRIAVGAFKLKYNGLVGDMTNASAFFPDCDPDPSKCNGNGDRYIDVVDPPTPPDHAEELRAWQLLYKAGLTHWNMSGVADATTPFKVDEMFPVRCLTGPAQSTGWLKPTASRGSAHIMTPATASTW